MNVAEKELLDAFKEVEASGNRLGFLKDKSVPIAESLVTQEYLKHGEIHGLYRLNKEKL